MQTSTAVHERVEPDRDAERAAARTAARRFAFGAGAGAVPALAVFLWFVNLGRSNLFQRPVFGQFYDHQARGLLHGHFSVPGTGLGFEGIILHGRTYEYYGPFPALLRMPILLVTHRFDGRLTQVSMILAFAVALLGGARLLWRARTLVRRDAPVTTAETVVVALWTLVLGTGTALLFPASRAIVYHEAELWGTALALVALDAVVGAACRPSRARLALASVLSTCALLARASVGLGPAVALGVLAVIAFATPVVGERLTRSARARLRKGVLAALGFALATIVPVAVYALVNHAKFGTWFSVPFDKQVFSRLNPNRIAVLRSNGGSLFSLKYVPSTLVQYLRPDALRLTHLFPFLDFRVARPAVLLNVKFDTLDRTSSVIATMPGLVALGIIGCVAACRRALDATATRALVAVVAGALVAVGPTLAIGFIANRYLIDFLPLLLVPAAFGLQVLARRRDGRRAAGALRSRRAGAVVVVFLVLAAFAVWANTATALTYQRLDAPPDPALRTGFVGFQESVGKHVGTGGYDVVHVTRLPARRPADRLAVVGRCAGLYWSDPHGLWQGLELGPEGTHARLALRFGPGNPSGPVPLLTVGSGSDVLSVTVRAVGRGRVRFGAVDGTGHTVEGAPVAAPGGSAVLDASLDRALRQLLVTLDGRAVLNATGRSVPDGEAVPEPIVAGAGPVTSARPLPVATPLCDRVTRR